MKIGIIGYGEVGTAFAKDLKANGASSVAVFDILFENPAAKPQMAARAEADGVRVATSLQDVIAGADIVFSAVTADAVEAVAAEAAPFLSAGQVFLDLNSASPDDEAPGSRTRVGLGSGLCGRRRDGAHRRTSPAGFPFSAADRLRPARPTR